jgi:hypothetical protein
LIQSWIFFGLASEALGRDVVHDEFIEKSDGGGYSDGSIDLRIAKWFWSELHERWDDLRRKVPRMKFENIKQKLEGCLKRAQIVVCLFDLDTKEEPHESLELVLLSVHMLLFVIGDLLHTQVIRPNLQLKSTRVLTKRMTKNG